MSIILLHILELGLYKVIPENYFKPFIIVHLPKLSVWPLDQICRFSVQHGQATATLDLSDSTLSLVQCQVFFINGSSVSTVIAVAVHCFSYHSPTIPRQYRIDKNT